MKRVSILFFIIALVFISCKGKSVAPEGKDIDIKSISEDSTEIRKTILDFYTWYSRNYEKFMQFNLYSGLQKKDTPPYKINWEEVKKYQDYIRGNVPQLGEEFLKNQTVLFKKCDSAFKVDVEEEIPYYFDFDLYTNSQEDPQYLLDEIKKTDSWQIAVNNNKAAVEISGSNIPGDQPAFSIIYIELQKENNTWKIAKIGNE